MTCDSLWIRLCRLWLEAGQVPADPRLAADARMPPAVLPRVLSPLVSAWLR